MTTLMIILAGLVSLEYLLIAVYIVPRLARLADGPGSLIHAAAWGAAAFFLGCSVTHLAIAVQSLHDPMMMSDRAMLFWHVLPHIAQVVGGAVFIWIASRRLDIRLAAKEVAARLQEVEQRFRASFERAPIGMALISLQPNSAGLLLQANPALGAMVGSTPRELQGRTVASLTYSADAGLLPETGPATAPSTDESDPVVEKRYQHSDGREVWVAVQSSVVHDHDGDPLYSVAQIRDLTEQRALEARVRQGQKMEAIGSLASGVAHDFNNVLSIIRSATQGGTLTIRTRAVTLDEQYVAAHPEIEAGPFVLLEVNDSGEGLDAATIEHMFDPFFTTKATGTGLGLATVYGIVKQSEGHLAVYSEPGMGANFQIYLPLAGRPDVAQAAQAPSSQRPAPGGTILLVDDAGALRSLLQRVLTAAGYTVLSARDGVAAIELARAHDGPIDLLFTDVVMPNMGGRELVDALRESRPDTKVIFTSGYPSDALIREDIAAGSVAFIQKPFTNVDLLAMIAAALA